MTNCIVETEGCVKGPIWDQWEVPSVVGINGIRAQPKRSSLWTVVTLMNHLQTVQV